MDQHQVPVSKYKHFSDIRIIPLVVRYHPPISDAGVSVCFTGGNFLGARCKDHAGLEPGASNGSAASGQCFQPHG